MLVVVLIPLILMVIACALERFEARAVPRSSAHRGPRAARTTPLAIAPAPAERERHLQLVATTYGDDERSSHRDVVLDPATLRLSRPHAQAS